MVCLQDKIMQWLKRDPRMDSLLDCLMYKRLDIILQTKGDLEGKQLWVEKSLLDYNKTAMQNLLKSHKFFYNKGVKLLINTREFSGPRFK